MDSRTIVASDHAMDKPINGRWHITCFDTENNWQQGRIQVYPDGKGSPPHLTATGNELHVVLLDHRKHQWLTEDQMRILLQAVILGLKSGSNK